MKKIFDNFDPFICTYRSRTVGLSLDEFINIPRFTKEDYDKFEKGIFEKKLDPDVKEAIEEFFKQK